jgi:Endodeoxyribonuclease RusA
LTKEAMAFREKVKGIVVSNLGSVSRLPTDQESVYRIDLDVYIDSLENPGWFEFFEQDTFVTRGPKKGQVVGRQGERKAKTRYKVVDVDNRIKFLQDCVCKSVGIPNDCQVFQVGSTKYEDANNPRVEVTITVLDVNQFFPNKEVAHGT